MLAKVTVLSQRKSGRGISWPNWEIRSMAQSLVFIFVMLLQSKTEEKKTKKKNKDAQHLIAVLPKFFLPFCRPAMAELCCGGRVLLNYQNQSTERENWCSFLMHSGRENQKWKSGYSEWTFSKFGSLVCVKLLRFQHENSWTLWSLFLFHVLQTIITTWQILFLVQQLFSWVWLHILLPYRAEMLGI